MRNSDTDVWIVDIQSSMKVKTRGFFLAIFQSSPSKECLGVVYVSYDSKSSAVAHDLSAIKGTEGLWLL